LKSAGDAYPFHHPISFSCRRPNTFFSPNEYGQILAGGVLQKLLLKWRADRKPKKDEAALALRPEF
jgi:hypothetical protein